jgi:carbamoyl-phosphate synthase small subunit
MTSAVLQAEVQTREGAELGMIRHKAATLLLADGSCFHGRGLGPSGILTGELVFTTAMTGYQEALTDPSYRGQILMFTYPLIGNYGVAPGRAQSDHIHARAAVMATLTDGADSPSLAEYLLANEIPAMYGVDTRAIAQRVRTHGAMAAALSVHEPGMGPTLDTLRSRLQMYDYEASDFVSETTILQPETYGYGRRLIALLDCGNKQRVVDELVRRNVRVMTLPAHTSAPDILALAPDGLVISNGPGNPMMARGIIETVRQLYGRLPIFGICLGHQLLALAAGGRTFKLKFGHRGANHPVQDCTSGRAFITTQNHGYAVDPASLPPDLLVSHRNLNDGTVEGLRHRTLPIRSVQFHPEGAPGPRDAGAVLDEWLELVA